MKENIVAIKSDLFAIEVIHLCRQLRKKNEYELASQILRAGTSIGANIAESKEAQSRKDFINKLSIAHKEARETRYWLNLLLKSTVCTIDELSCIKLLEEILALLTKIQKTLKTNHPLN